MSCHDVYTDHMEEELKIKLYQKLVCTYISLPIAWLDNVHDTKRHLFSLTRTKYKKVAHYRDLSHHKELKKALLLYTTLEFKLFLN